MMTISSAQIYRFDSDKNIEELCKSIEQARDGQGKSVHIKNISKNIGTFTYTYNSQTDEYNYHILLKHRLIIVAGKSERRNTATKTFIREVLDKIPARSHLLTLERKHAGEIIKKLIERNPENKIIKPKFDFGKGFKYKDTTYRKFEFSLGDDVCAKRIHADFNDFYDHCNRLDFKASVLDYPGLADNRTNPLKVNIRQKFAVSIYKDMSLKDWHDFFISIIDII